MPNIKKMDHYNNHKTVDSLNIQPTSVMKEIAEKFCQLNNGLINISDVVRFCHSCLWDVQSFVIGSCHLVCTNPVTYRSLFGIQIERLETLSIYFDENGTITKLSCETMLVENSSK